MRNRIAPLLVLASLASFAPPVSRAATPDFQSWQVLIVQEKKPTGLKGYFELQPRYSEDATRLNRLLVRPAIIYGLPDGWSLFAGYLWQPVYQPRHVVENRVWQQVQNDWKQDTLYWIQNRLRFEERFVGGADLSFRLRYQLRGLVRLGGSSWYGVASNELFYTVGRPIPGSSSGFDQDRLFGGMHCSVTPELRIEGGYMLNPVRTTPAVPDRLNHNLVVTALVSL